MTWKFLREDSENSFKRLKQLKTNSKRDEIASSDFWPEKTLLTRVWSWLRMNAGGVPNTCKSNEALVFDSSDEDTCDWVADGWVTRG